MENLKNLERFRLTGDTYYYEVSPDNSIELVETLNKSGGPVGISVNFNKFEFESIEFALRIKNLIGVRVLGDGCSLEPLADIRSLENLILEGVKKPNLDFKSIESLINIRTDWYPSLSSLFDAKQLKSLAIWGYKPKTKNCTDFFQLTSLKTLCLTRGNIDSLEGLAHLESLQSIELNYLRNLSDIALIARMTRLESIEIESCPKVFNAEMLLNLPKLKTLKLINAGTLSSLRGIEKNSHLKYLNLHKTSIIDGDLEPLIKISSLRDLKIDNKSHHSHRLDELVKILGI